MFEFFYTKKLHGLHGTLSSFGAEGKFQNWILLSHLLGELWGNEGRIGMVQDFIEYALSIDPDENCIGFDGAYVEEKGEYFAISYEWEGDVEFLFPKEKFKQFIDEVERALEEVYSKSIFESPDRVKFIIDDDWNTCIEQVYLNADASFFERDGSGIPQFRLARIKGQEYKLIEKDCLDDPISKTLGMFVEDVWALTREQSPVLKVPREKEGRRFDYKRSYFEKKGNVFRLMQTDWNEDSRIILTEDQMSRLIVLTKLFCSNLHDAPLDKLPGVIFFTFDEYWNLIPGPLFRPEDKNFVDKE